jgi:hypothetical protein
VSVDTFDKAGPSWRESARAWLVSDKALPFLLLAPSVILILVVITRRLSSRLSSGSPRYATG